jgi:excisionase family DNA binding protein
MVAAASPICEWLTLSEAAALANVSKATLNRWVNSGVVPSSATLPVGRTRVRYARSWFQARMAPGEGVRS